MCSRSFLTRALDHARPRALTFTATARQLGLTAPALAIVRARGFGTKLLSETTYGRLSPLGTRMASSAVAAAAVSDRPAVSAQSGEARIIDGTLLAKYALSL